MDESKTQTFYLSVNDFGQKICTSQSNPAKRYILDDDGNMLNIYQPETSICAIKFEQSDTNNDNSNEPSLTDNNDITALEDPTQLGMINAFSEVEDFDENLMNKLDTDFMNMVPDEDSHYIMQHMDIREPLSKLKKLLEQRLGLELPEYSFSLQGTQMLESHKNLVDQCVQGEGLVQINVQVQTSLKRINIIDVLKPAEDYIHVEESNETSPQKENKHLSEAEHTQVEKPKNIVQWQVDIQYKKEQERLRIPTDPMEWSVLHVRHWLQWAVRQFSLPNVKLSDWTMTGKGLYDLTLKDFQKIVPNDPGDVFWTHLELLRKMKVVDWFYCVKVYFSKRAVHEYQEKQKKKRQVKGPEIENFLNISDNKSSDTQYIFGSDQKGNNLSIKLAVRSKKIAEAYLVLRVADGNVYEFPGDQNVVLQSINKDQWKTKELELEILEPFRRIRVTFNGLLKNTVQKSEEIFEHVQFSFVWNALNRANFFPEDADLGLLAKSVATNTWKDGNWKTMLSDTEGYCQFGALQGYVKGDSYPNTIYLNLATCRSRYWGIQDAYLISKEIRINIASVDGTVINLVAKSFKDECNQLTYGSIISNAGRIFSIKDCDLKLPHLGNVENIPAVFSVHIKGQDKDYKCVFHANKTKSSKMVNEEIDGYICWNVPCDCDINTVQAKAIVEFWYRLKGKGTMEKPASLLSERKIEKLPTTLVTNIKSEDSKILEITGGKGNSLALLSSLESDKFTVPEGFIVTVNAFKKQMDENLQLRASINVIEDICCGKVNGNIENACKTTVSFIKSTSILPEIKKAIIEEIEAIISNMENSELKSTGWAVRSSAIGEDSEELSAAGQNETFLGCYTHESIVKSVVYCWASLYTYQSVQYRWQHGLAVKADMAVVVQKMVPADAAGVLFTCHPSTCNPSQIVITSNYGLGESVVSGQSDPDTFILKRSWDEKISFESSSIGIKNKMIRLTADGTEEVERKNTTENECSISKEQAVLLGHIGVLLENAFGGHRDIEWAIYKNRVYLLQSRPITTLKSWTDYELLHELDSPILSEENVFTVANAGEVFPGAVSVLSQTTMARLIDNALKIRTKQEAICLSTIQHHVLINVIDCIHKNVKDEITVASKILDLAIFGHPVINEHINTISMARFGKFTPLKAFKQTSDVIWNAFKSGKFYKKAMEHSKKFEICVTKQDDARNVYEKIEKALEEALEIGVIHCITTTVGVFYQIVAMTLLLEVNTEISMDHYNDIALLLSSCQNVVSAEVPVLLEKISATINATGSYHEFLKIDPVTGRDWLKENCPEASVLFEKFLKRHGHRLLGEFELQDESWGSNPAKVISMLQANTTGGAKTEKKNDTVDEVVAKLVSPKSNITRKILKFIVRKMRAAVGLRENTKSELVRTVNKIRIAYKELAKKMVNEGLLPTEDIIYHLTQYEVKKVIERRSPLLISKALRRKRLHSTWNKLKFPEIMNGIPQPENNNDELIDFQSDILLVGTPVCNGTIKARACVITTLDEIDQLQTGDILVTYSTDIGWSPYFPLLSGVVTELGGLVSHGAVVAREYGLPCIVGVRGVTKLFKTGDIVLLTGHTGTLQRDSSVKE